MELVESVVRAAVWAAAWAAAWAYPDGLVVAWAALSAAWDQAQSVHLPIRLNWAANRQLYSHSLQANPTHWQDH